MRLPSPSSKDEAIASLDLFNLKFDKIAGYSFFTKANKISFRLESNLASKESSVKVQIPSEEQLDAVLLHLRFFNMGNEHSSFHHLPQAYQVLQPSTKVADGFKDAFNEWMTWREKQTGFFALKNCDFMATMLFGERIHRNDPRYHEVYQTWMGHNLLSGISTFLLCNKVFEMMEVLAHLRVVNEMALAETKQPAAPKALQSSILTP